MESPMRNYLIKKGKHRACPITLGLYYNKKSISRKVIFDKSCAYLLEGEDQEDINKLFGIGYFPSHHQESARFGWRYNPTTDKIELLAYCYRNKERIIQSLAELSFGQEYNLKLEVNEGTYSFFIEEGLTGLVPKNHNKKLAFPLGPYFGGNQTAPHNITIKINKTQ